MDLTFNFEERSFSGKTFRPRPEVHFDPDSKLLLVATPWGQRASARKAIDRMLEYFLLAKGDKEVTSPFARMTCLSAAANHLRTAALLANEMIFREDNRNEYKAGVELFGASFIDNEFVWMQIGQPQIMLSRASGRFLPLGGYVDLSLDISEGKQLLPALPNQLLGLDLSVNLTINSFRAQPGDRVVLLSHSAPPSSLYSLKPEDLTTDRLSAWLAKSEPDAAFWLGVLNLERAERSIVSESSITTGSDLRP